MLADHDVLEDGHGGEEADVLEGACHAQLQDLVGSEAHYVLPAEDDGTLVRGLHPRDQVEERGLSGPIWPDDADNLALVDVQLQAVDGAETAECLVQALYLEQRHQTAPSGTCSAWPFSP